MAGRETEGEGILPAQRQFTRQADFYVVGEPFRTGESLVALVRFASLGRYGVVVDLGTGAGFTAFAVSPYAGEVILTDVTREMLVRARQLARERGVDNTGFALVMAEHLPFRTGSLDAVTSRFAAHHFTSIEGALREMGRVLKRGGVLLLADSVAPEEPSTARWMNDVERRRDRSHIENIPPSRWRELLPAFGFRITHTETARVYLEFNDWVRRAGTPPGEVEALRRDFLGAPEGARRAFAIKPRGDTIDFSWPCLVVRAEKT
jgi:ubiquinone/menaquinone biosynthesis C-methylase UbiE